MKKYGEAANLPEGMSRGAAKFRGKGGGRSVPSKGPASKVHKPYLDEMHGPESLPYRPERDLPAKPFGSTSRIIQPTDSRQSGPEFGPSPRSTGGAPGHRGGWKKR
jgi:excinuclease ABC subunit B